ncbi:hypothetical protein RHGRI_010132 [Rhododendron griersonianum]|uniref:DUF1421 domain-containing protein n=1 Tax=Rhododendron griersonianum TaxID=479676 RepID=A0AAV6KHA2_9ERIC|nr:hypothetical protein RHGRI_010132 [Rhododendron griersonianum]
MASGSSGRNNNSGTKAFDFATTDDILCSYEDYGSQDGSNGIHADPVIGSNSAKVVGREIVLRLAGIVFEFEMWQHFFLEFHKSRMARSSIFPASAYGPPEDSFNQDVISSVEKTMKKHTDNLMRFLEGLSSRLSQLELYCYNLDKSIGEMHSDLVRDHGEADLKLKSLEKHMQEVHRSVQLLRDKQELADTQKELAKLQLAQKESSSSTHSQQKEEKASPPAADPKATDNTPDMHGQQLALALPHQVAPQPSLPSRPMEQPQPVAPPPSVTQSQAYYYAPPQMPNIPTQVPAQALGPAQASQGQYLQSDAQYRAPQMQQPGQTQVNQAPQVHQLPQYQQQWAQQLPQHVGPPQTSMQPQIRPQSTAVYPPYLPSQPPNPSPAPETLPSSMSMQMPYPGISQQGGSRVDTMPYGYGGPGRTVQQQQPQQQPPPQQPPPQQLKSSFGVQPGEGYTASGSHPSLSPGNAYMMYDGEAGRTHHPTQPPHFQQGGYPPTSVPLQGSQSNPNSSSLMVRPPQFMRNHPYNELIEKLVNMGYRGDHVNSVIQRLEESGQTVDFNTVLDRLNGHSSGGSQRGWSG